MTERHTAETWSQYSARLEHERRELEQRAQQAERIVAALVRKYGEPIGDGIRRAVLTEQDLTEDWDGTLSVNLDPCSGAMLIRFRPL